MTWPVRTKRFGLYTGTPVAATFTLLGTVPAGKTWLLKDWHAYNGHATTRSFTMCIRIGAVVYIVDHSPTTPAGTPTGNSNRHVAINAGEDLGFITSTNGLCHVGAHGAQLG